MLPTSPRKSLTTENFKKAFQDAKGQFYYDPAIKPPPIHSSSPYSIRCVAWNPTGALIAVASMKALRVWNPDKPRLNNSTELRGHNMGGVTAIGWNPVREAELASVSTDGTCKFWDVRNKICTSTVKLGDEGWSLCWAPDGSVVMDDTLVQIITDPTPTVGEKFPQAIQTKQLHFNWSTPPTHLFVTRSDGTVSINAYPSMKTLQTLHAHTSSCESIALSPTGRYLAIGASDALISLWDTTDWVCLRTVDSIVGTVKSISFTFDGSYLIGADDTGDSLDVVHVESGESAWKIKDLAKGATAVAWHPSRYWIAWAGEGGIFIPSAPNSTDKDYTESPGLRIVRATGIS